MILFYKYLYLYNILIDAIFNFKVCFMLIYYAAKLVKFAFHCYINIVS